MRIALHLGAHKTASTFLQGVLAGPGAEALRSRGVKCVPLDDLRRGVTRRLGDIPALAPARAARRRALAEHSLAAMLAEPGLGRLILSDENLIGTPREIVRMARPYPDPLARLDVLPALLAGREVELFLAIRHMGSFARSIYCEYLRQPGPEFHAPDPFAQAWAERMPSWLPLVETIRAAFPGAPLTVWDHALMRNGSQRILNAIAGTEPPLELETAGVLRRASLSHAAVCALVEIGATSGAEEMQKRVREMARAHPLRRGNWTYEMWDKDAQAAFQNRFVRDLRALRDMPGVTLLSAG